jgi:hypothetical protein
MLLSASLNRLRVVIAIVVMALVATAAVPSQADLADQIEKLKQERAELKKSREDQAVAIDASTAEANELAAALAVLSGQVNEQEGRLAAAEEALGAAEDRFAEASQAVVDKTAEIARLEVQVSDRAISAFVDQNVGSTPVLENTDPNRAVRMQSLVESVTRQEVDVAEQLREAKEDLAIEEARADRAADEAAALRATIEEELIALQAARDEQAALTEAAERRLESQLAEAAIMAERDKAISSEISQKSAELQKQLELAARRNNPAPTSQSNPSFPSSSELRKVGGFWVHVDIADNLQRMLDAAAADGIVFGGWGYRDHAAQIRLRKAHCGTSNYAIYQMSASRCRPPTARPGASMHEQGKAIDFTYGGRTIGSRSSAGFKWLAANAANYGFYNLPSEPWHWSVNGN